MRMRRTVRDAWVKALRSGEYEQATGALCKVVDTDEDGTPKVGYCCLGVLSELAVEAGVDVQVDGYDEDIVGEVAKQFGFEVNYPPATVAEWANPLPGAPLGGDPEGWAVQVIDRDSRDGEPHEVALADANDGGASFAEIADLIENDLDRDGDVRDDLAEVTA